MRINFRGPFHVRTISLALLAIFMPPYSLAAQAIPYSVDDLLHLVRGQVPEPRIIELARTSCLAFQLDAAATAVLRNAGATTSLISALRGTCYASGVIVVTTDPPGADVWLGDRRVGTAPWSSRLVPADRVRIGVRRGTWTRATTVTIGERQRVRVHFDVPADTSVWPVARTRDEIADEVEAQFVWSPTSPPPQPPREPSREAPTTARWLLSILGAVGGAVGGHALEPDTAAVAVSGALAGLGLGFLAGKALDESTQRRRLRRHQEAMMRYQDSLTRWQDAMAAQRTQALARAVDAAWEAERARTDSIRVQVQRRNEEIKQRNRTLSPPRVTVERIP